MSCDANRPYPVINRIECKACGRCIDACPKDVLFLSAELNERGYHYAVYRGEGCTGCANCFYACPEPNTITVHRPPRKRSADDPTQG
ncbi:MAG: ferredoxin family protein [Lentisphaeria bacterium]|nr:ferredoxin family protein [Lentisphaeria bacterium]